VEKLVVIFPQLLFQMINHFLLSIVFQRKAPGTCNPSGLLTQNFESKLGYKSAAALSAACLLLGCMA
jgi:hypothetical protein